jgi:hypothetical protein
MPRKNKSPTGTVEFVNKPDTAPEPSILSEPPSVDIPEQGDPTSAPAPPPAPKAKRPYTKKHGAYWEAMSKSRKDMLMPKPKPKPTPEPKNEIIHPDAPDAPTKRRPGRPKKVVPVPAPVPAPVPVPVKAKKEKAPPKPLKVKAKPKKVPVYTAPSESDEDDDDDDDDETDEEEEEPVIEVVAQKANRRLKTLDKIDRRIKELSNSYSAKGYSVF